jgi:hypothetical protein
MTNLKPYWMSYTIRNDCCDPRDIGIFNQSIRWNGTPSVLTLWTKQPALVAAIWKDTIKSLKDSGVIVISMITLNNYGPEMEPGRQPEYDDPSTLMKLVDRTFFRIDPILIGYTAPKHLNKTFQFIKDYHTLNLEAVKLSIGVFHRKGIGNLFKQRFPQIKQQVSIMEQYNVMNGIKQACLKYCSPYIPEFQACAESVNIKGLVKKPCHDIELIKQINSNTAAYLESNRNGIDMPKTVPNRNGCTCFPYTDGGKYDTWADSHRCKMQCVYCYAKS